VRDSLATNAGKALYSLYRENPVFPRTGKAHGSRLPKLQGSGVSPQGLGRSCLAKLSPSIGERLHLGVLFSSHSFPRFIRSLTSGSYPFKPRATSSSVGHIGPSEALEFVPRIPSHHLFRHVSPGPDLHKFSDVVRREAIGKLGPAQYLKELSSPRITRQVGVRTREQPIGSDVSEGRLTSSGRQGASTHGPSPGVGAG
jgi:hypothetical protein